MCRTSKRLCLYIIILSVYAAVMIRCQPQQLKNLGYEQFLDLYAPLTASWTPLEILRDPLASRAGPYSCGAVKVALPGCRDYPGVIEDVLQHGYTALVECSAFDRWHTTEEGLLYLTRMKGKTCRVVVFDGGHHLPTLGLEPDILIIPRLRGYAAHSYMKDGMKVEKIMALAREAGIPTVIAAVPRWSLVKHETGLEMLTQRILRESSASPGKKSNDLLLAVERMSRYRGLTFAYITGEDLCNPDGFLRRYFSMDGESKKMYLAVDYRSIDYNEASQWAGQIEKAARCPVQIVNEPVTVLDVLWSD